MSELTAQWKCDNQAEFDELLRDFEINTRRESSDLLITGPDGLEIELKPGDCVILKDGQIGILRVPDEARGPKPSVIHAECAECQKPITVGADVLTDPETLIVVCSTECENAFKFKNQFIEGPDGQPN